MSNQTGPLGGGIGASGAGVGGASGGIAGFTTGRGMSQPPAPETKADATLTFVVDADVGQRLLTDATEKGLAAATDALPGRGRVRAQGSLGNVREGKRVRIDLDVRGEGATRAWALAAETAFAEAFLARLEAKGHSARRLDRPG